MKHPNITARFQRNNDGQFAGVITFDGDDERIETDLETAIVEAAKVGFRIRDFEGTNAEFEIDPAETAERIKRTHSKDSETYEVAEQYLRDMEALGERPEANADAWKRKWAHISDNFHSGLNDAFHKIYSRKSRQQQVHCWLVFDTSYGVEDRGFLKLSFDDPYPS